MGDHDNFRGIMGDDDGNKQSGRFMDNSTGHIAYGSMVAIFRMVVYHG